MVSRILNPLGALILLLVALPCLIILALVLLVFDQQHPLTTVLAVSDSGRVFYAYYFRTETYRMRPLAIQQLLNTQDYSFLFNPAPHLRLTELGALLRATYMYRLPLLYNVLQGDLTLGSIYIISAPTLVLKLPLDSYPARVITQAQPSEEVSLAGY